MNDATPRLALVPRPPAEPADIEARLEEIALDIDRNRKSAILKIGEKLIEAQLLLKHRRGGQGFQAWVQTRLGFSPDTAYNMINSYKALSAQKSELAETFGKLPTSTLYLLEAPRIDEEVRRIVAERLAAGEYVTAQEIKDLKAEVAAAKEKEQALAEKDQELEEALEKIIAAKGKLEEDLEEARSERQANAIRLKMANAMRKDGRFDNGGVMRVFKEIEHQHAFWTAIKPLGEQLLLSSQVPFAKAILEDIRDNDFVLNEESIRYQVANQAHAFKVEQRREAKTAKERNETWELKARELQDKFSQTIKEAWLDMEALARHSQDRPEGVTLYRTNDFKEAVAYIRKLQTMLKEI